MNFRSILNLVRVPPHCRKLVVELSADVVFNIFFNYFSRHRAQGGGTWNSAIRTPAFIWSLAFVNLAVEFEHADYRKRSRDICSRLLELMFHKAKRTTTVAV